MTDITSNIPSDRASVSMIAGPAGGRSVLHTRPAGSSDCARLAPLLRAAAAQQARPVSGDQRVFLAARRDLAGLTDTDRELIAVVTGEQLPAVIAHPVRVSFFTLQIALDRLVGPLRGGADVTVEYLEAVYTAYDESCAAAGNPVDGDLLDLGLAYLVGRDLARQERISLVA